ncbi:unnamed protein product [Auanema sp. JU1783]|nr:unnamed protein product [Auanema sp. JU1783]
MLGKLQFCNEGYLSEAGASLVDRKLGLNVVPQTGIVELAAPTFCYGRFDRAKARTMERIYSRYPDIARRVRMMGLPPKRGSFQLFVVGYKDAAIWLKQWESNKEKMSEEEKKSFQFQFEKIVILDYIIRNTDRGNDNWLIKCEEAENNTNEQFMENAEEETNPNQEEEEKLIDFSDSATDEAKAKNENDRKDDAFASSFSNYENVKPFNKISIAAIDNGLAFPFKHPDEWRTYPFGWSSLPQSRIPFSDEIINLLFPLLNNTEFVKELGEDLRNIFKIDRGFDKHLFERQLSVLRGQIFNLREALRQKKSPYQLVAMPPQYMIEVKKKKKSRFHRSRQSSLRMNPPEVGVEANPLENDINSETSAPPPPTPAIAQCQNTSSWHEAYQQKVHTRNPFFRLW